MDTTSRRRALALSVRLELLSDAYNSLLRARSELNDSECGVHLDVLDFDIGAL